MEKCPKCDSIITKDQTFCTFCGEIFDEEKMKEISQAPTKPTPTPDDPDKE